MFYSSSLSLMWIFSLGTNKLTSHCVKVRIHLWIVKYFISFFKQPIYDLCNQSFIWNYTFHMLSFLGFVAKMAFNFPDQMSKLDDKTQKQNQNNFLLPHPIHKNIFVRKIVLISHTICWKLSAINNLHFNYGFVLHSK